MNVIEQMSQINNDNHPYRQAIVNAVQCPKCLASVGIQCWQSGITSYPHSERIVAGEKFLYKKVTGRTLLARGWPSHESDHGWNDHQPHQAIHYMGDGVGI